MAFITMICQNCGGQAQIEAGRSAICPYCGNEMTISAAETGSAFAQDVQYAPPPAQAAVQQMQDPFLQRAAMQQQAAMPMPQQNVMPMQPAAYAPQYTPAQLDQAAKKRHSWHFMNTAMIAVQALVLSLGVILDDHHTDIGVPMILGWLMSQPACGFISGILRPDHAYLDRKPLFKSKVVQGFVQFGIGMAASAIGGGLLYAIIDSMF